MTTLGTILAALFWVAFTLVLITTYHKEHHQ